MWPAEEAVRPTSSARGGRYVCRDEPPQPGLCRYVLPRGGLTRQRLAHGPAALAGRPGENAPALTEGSQDSIILLERDEVPVVCGRLTGAERLA